MKKAKNIFGVLCIIAALCLLIIPPICENYKEKENNTQKDELLLEIEDLISTLENETVPNETLPEVMLPIISETQTDTAPTTPPTTEPQQPTVYVPYRTSTNEEVDGILYIPSIDVELPILTNVTEKGLKKTCARVTNTNPPGAKNYCIMGHSLRTYGYIFNRLHEVKSGDLIIVKARNYTYTYKVYETFVTKGLDVQIFEDIPGKNVVTLFCCSYDVKNGRLVVRGELTKIEKNT